MYCSNFEINLRNYVKLIQYLGIHDIFQYLNSKLKKNPYAGLLCYENGVHCDFSQQSIMKRSMIQLINNGHENPSHNPRLYQLLNHLVYIVEQ